MKFKPPFRFVYDHAEKRTRVADSNGHVVKNSGIIRLLNAGAKALAAKKPKVAPVKLHSGWVLNVGVDYVCWRCTRGRHRKPPIAHFIRRYTSLHDPGALCLACARKGLPE